MFSNYIMFSLKYIFGIFMIILTFTELKAQRCPSVNITNGYTILRSRGRVIKFYCDKGFRIFGNKKARCRTTGWTKRPPICYAPGCAKFEKLEYGNITAHGTFLMLLECQKGYLLMGYNAMYCNGSSWSSELPTCKVPGDIDYCDFEYETMCGWGQDSNDDFDWTWHHGKTHTGRTGPQYDHTYQLQNKIGHYMYLEMSPPRKSGDVARLASPRYNSSKSGQCFQIWYHMLGPDKAGEVGIMKIIIRKNMTGEDVTLYEVAGNQGDLWHLADVFIEKISESFQIIIEGTRRRSYVGDIAIDDLRFYTCTVTTSEIPSPSKSLVLTETTTGPIRSQTDVTTEFSTTLSLEQKVSTFSETRNTKEVNQPTFNILDVTETDGKTTWSSAVMPSSDSVEDVTFDKGVTETKEDILDVLISVTTDGTIISKETTRNLESNTTRDLIHNNFTLSEEIINSKTTIQNRLKNVTQIPNYTNATRNYTVNNTPKTLQEQFLSYMENNLSLIIAIIVCFVFITSAAVVAVVIHRRRKRADFDNVLEEMKASFVYKRSVDFTSS